MFTIPSIRELITIVETHGMGPGGFTSVSDDPERWVYRQKDYQSVLDSYTNSKTIGNMTLYFAPDPYPDPEIFGTITPIIDDRIVGNLFVCFDGDGIKCSVEVDPKYRRIGIATAMYDWAEELTGKTATPDTPHTPYAREFWHNRLKTK